MPISIPLDEYFVSLEKRLRNLGLDAVSILRHLMVALECRVCPRTAGRHFVVWACIRCCCYCALGSDDDRDELVAIDMGGTSCDMSITRGGSRC
ncbi:MAG: hypothetical protein CM1200mP41_21750 [Gammaproteobacteria bacterium]|nr:MAG: hypothetical protein CM1200mP41_21750 [Gammaproteobacteria bacterium]